MLSPAEKRWLRKMVRDEFAAVVEGLTAEQIGGYDGATHVADEEEDTEDKKPAAKPRVGFVISEQAGPKRTP